MSLRSEVIRIFNELLGNSKKISELPPAAVLTGTEEVELNQGGTSVKTTTQDIADLANPSSVVKIVQVAASDEITSLTTGTAKITFRVPQAMTLTAVRASLTVSQYSGNILTVDINNNGSSILSTKITIDNMEETSTTAVTPPVISSTSLGDDSEITIDIDQIGDGTAKGLKVTLIGT